LINFFVVGAQKSGTTSLYSLLDAHPDCCLARPKELHFFDTERYFHGSVVDYGPLHQSLLPKLGQICGECTPVNMFYPPAMERIYLYNASAKLICILRNPLERAFSHWNMQRQRGLEQLSFINALHQESSRIADGIFSDSYRLYSYCNRGLYSDQLKRMLSWFPPSQVLILRFEELKQDPSGILNRITSFLGIRQLQIPLQHEHARAYDGQMSSEAREYLRNFFSSELMCLQTMLNWDLSDWF